MMPCYDWYTGYDLLIRGLDPETALRVVEELVSKQIVSVKGKIFTLDLRDLTICVQDGLEVL